jgi:hypothetical protein
VEGEVVTLLGGGVRYEHNSAPPERCVTQSARVCCWGGGWGGRYEHNSAQNTIFALSPSHLRAMRDTATPGPAWVTQCCLCYVNSVQGIVVWYLNFVDVSTLMLSIRYVVFGHAWRAFEY